MNFTVLFGLNVLDILPTNDWSVLCQHNHIGIDQSIIYWGTCNALYKFGSHDIQCNLILII